ncbi:hypothetical protein, partial [Pseudomonas savastanoi]
RADSLHDFVYTLLASADECLLQGFTMMLLSHQILFIEAIWGGMARPSLKFGSQMMYRIHRFCCRFPADREQVRSYALRAEAWTYE